MIVRLLRLAPLVLALTLQGCQLLAPLRERGDADPQTPVAGQIVPEEPEAAPPGTLEEPELSGPPSAHDVSGEPPVEVLVAGGAEGIDSIDATESESVHAVPAGEQEIWARIRAGFRLDDRVSDPRIDREIAWYSRNQEYLDRVTARAERYLYFILEEVDARHLPTELVLLPIVESAFDPFAYSHSRAMGIWQFIPSTGDLYGLKRDWWYDGRRDVRAATCAALDYLEDLYKEFDGDWALALAAYNSGAGNVRSAIARNERLHRPTDFWSLKLLQETSSYVPRLFAIARLVAHPEAYGTRFQPIPDRPYWAEVDIGGQIDLTLAAKLAGISVSELYLLNPGFNRWASRPDGPHTLLVPADHAGPMREHLAALPPDSRVGWRRHRIEEGETLGSIAARFNTTVPILRQVNHLRGSVIRAGDSVMIPSALQATEQYTLSDEQRRNAAERYYTRELGGAPVIHRVANGDTLWDLARKYGVEYRALARWNGMATTDPLKIGQELKVWSKQPLLVADGAVSERPEVIRKLNYRVRPGESLSRIASKFNLTVSEIKEWNRQLEGRRYLQPGDQLTLYVDVIQGE